MSFEIKGKVYKIFPTENKTQTFQAREFVIEVDDRGYTQYIKFQLTQDRCGLLDSYQSGDFINVHFDLRGREWQEKFFTNLNAWRIERVNEDATETGGPTDVPAEFMDLGNQVDDTKAEDFDDLPF